MYHFPPIKNEIQNIRKYQINFSYDLIKIKNQNSHDLVEDLYNYVYIENNFTNRDESEFFIDHYVCIYKFKCKHLNIYQYIVFHLNFFKVVYNLFKHTPPYTCIICTTESKKKFRDFKYFKKTFNFYL